MAVQMSTSPSTPNINWDTTTVEKRPLDGIILVMGMTGSGKSSFIKLITEDTGIKVGHGVESETSEIGVHNWTASDGRVFALVDTPGFDDSNGKSDSDVLDQIASFLKGTYGMIIGIIYCHRIDTRAGGLTIRNLRMFEKLCGTALKNAVLLTTHRDKVGDEAAVDLERQLVTGEKYFKPLCDAGATTFGHNDTRASAQRVMNKLLDNTPIVLHMQEELKAGMTLEGTAAGSLLSADLGAQIKEHEAELKKLREELEDAIKAGDKVWQKDVTDSIGESEETVKRSTASREQLKKPPSQSGMWEKIMGYGWGQSGFVDMFARFAWIVLEGGYRIIKATMAKAAIFPNSTIEEANQEYERN